MISLLSTVGFTSEAVWSRAWTLSIAETKEEFSHVLSCGDNYISLYRGLRGQEYYWPEMAKEGAKLQSIKNFLIQANLYLFQEARDWRQPYLDFLHHR